MANETQDAKALVEQFYAQVLNAHGSADLPAAAAQCLAPEWQSVGNTQAPPKSREAFVAQVAGFRTLMPDLKWVVEEVLASGDRYVVRSRAMGTPRGPLFGVGPTGRHFDIMTIDIHTVKAGRIAHTFHVEDWAGALGQLRA